MPTDADDFLEAALATTESDNVVGGLTFLVQAAIDAKDPKLCYAEDLLRAAAAADSLPKREASRRLKAHYGKDFNITEWNAGVRNAKGELLKASPSLLLQTENGAIKPVLANAITQLQHSPLKLAYDVFSSKVVIEDRSPWGTNGPWRDIDDISASNYLQHHSVSVSSACANEAAYFVAHQNPFHPVRDWLGSLTWDGEPRLDTCVVEHFGVDDTVLNRAITTAWFISGVARIMRPGCKADHVIVFEGAQGKRKSMGIRALTNGHIDADSGTQWFRDSLDIEHDDAGLYMQGVWIIEFADLEGFRKSDWIKIKAFITSQSDSFRRKFGRNLQDYPRQCIFAASTNENNWAGDPTGARRFWPLRVGQINIDGILKNRDQLWAEARFRYDEGAKWWLPETLEEDAREAQAERAPEDAWTERVQHACALVADVSTTEVIDKLNERHGMGERSQVGRALVALGWNRYRTGAESGRAWRYRRGE